ncbi:hypothetical protein [Ancylobacter vacuolatus]|uniref:Uncharacterized protein n=1 Tax=Ancylobacter vacuolatus TaxID=223389 RepID=A0ABU0DHH0_9HYPH|nr:hypothetical protein [Ancylobacter vacuolatus]MDQ0347872.1 hypothetical protein [Ancylobacter vacuolatus]
MKLNRYVTTLAVVSAGICGWLLLRGIDPVTAAKLECEHHIEALTGYHLSGREVSALGVAGDVYNGKVQGAFIHGDKLSSAVCVFEAGHTMRVAVDGKVLEGR